MKLDVSMVKKSFQLLLVTAPAVVLTTGLCLAKGKTNTSLSVTLADGPIDMTFFGGAQDESPGISSDGQGAYVDRVDHVEAITGVGFRLDTAVNTSKRNPPVRFISFDFDGDGAVDFQATTDIRFHIDYYADEFGNLTDANGNVVSVADRVQENDRMIPKAMSPNSVARAALNIPFRTIDGDGNVRQWRLVFGDHPSGNIPSMPDAVPVWVFSGEDSGNGEPLDWTIYGTQGALFELVEVSKNNLVPEFIDYVELPVMMALDRLE